MRIEIKAMSVNEAFQGRRFKTQKYKSYENELLWLLKPLEVPEGDLSLKIVVGLRKNADIDNIAKPFIDILQKKYGFNDSQIMELHIKKICGEGSFIDFTLQSASH